MFKDVKNGRFYNGDCLEVMNIIPDGSVDMILCDLPYGTTMNKWDTIIPFDILWKQYKRVIKSNGAIVLTAQTPFDKILGMSNINQLRYELIWNKTQGTGFMNAKKMPLKSHENILVFYDKLPTYNPQMRLGFTPYKAKSGSISDNYNKTDSGFISISDGERYPISILEFSRDKKNIHPTQKPVALFEYLIRTYTNENELILDNCAGSGTTAIAAENINRRWVCIEKDKLYYDMALERISNHNILNDFV